MSYSRDTTNQVQKEYHKIYLTAFPEALATPDEGMRLLTKAPLGPPGPNTSKPRHERALSVNCDYCNCCQIGTAVVGYKARWNGHQNQN